MARTSKDQSNAQESDAQRSDAQTSPDSTSLTSGGPASASTPISPDDELAAVQDSVDAMLGKEDEESGADLISVKTNGPYLIHDITTGDTVEEKASKVRNSAFIQDQLEAGRIVKG